MDKKPVVPQFVADMIVKRKEQGDSLLTTLVNLGVFGDAQRWIRNGDNSDTFAKAWLYGYEVKKEKLYTVEIPTHGNPDHFVLRKHVDGRVCLDCYRSDNWRDYEFSQLTEAEIKKEHDWAWKFAEEVE